MFIAINMDTQTVLQKREQNEMSLLKVSNSTIKHAGREGGGGVSRG